MSELPTYPSEAAEREAAMGPERGEGELAGWWSRLGAYLLDTLLLFVPLAIVIGIAVAANPDENSGVWALVVVAYAASLVLPFVYFSIMHGGERGQTYGKRAVGIRVVDGEGGSIGHGRAFGRYAITFVFGIFVLPALLDYLWPLWDRKNQTLHDKVVGSLVVRA